MSVVKRRILCNVGVGMLYLTLLGLACNPLGNPTSSTAVEENYRGVICGEQGQSELAIDEFNEAIAVCDTDTCHLNRLQIFDALSAPERIATAVSDTFHTPLSRAVTC